MKLPESNIVTESGGLVKEYDFSVNVEDTGIIFDMLRSKIYKKPIDSICREIASNSRDANREVGKDDTPIEIIINDNKGKELINNSSLTIEFKDNGPGISPDRMENVFCKYAASTKRDTNFMTGGFGLGAKTPFSYTDTFTVTTIVDGIKYYYSAFIDESKRGKIILFNQEKTKENNGTSIIIPIDPKDRKEFEEKCIMYTLLWKTQPKYINFIEDIPKLEFYKENNSIKENFNIIRFLNNYNIFNKRIFILIDGIPYPYDNEISEFHFNYLKENYLLIFNFDNGSLDISVNRENLQFTDKTKILLTKRFIFVKEFFKKQFEDKIKNAKNYLHACAIYSTMHNGPRNTTEDAFKIDINDKFLNYMKKYLQSCNSFKDFLYDDKKLKTSFSFSPFLKIRKILSRSITDIENTTCRDILSENKFTDARDWYNLPVYYMDMQQRNVKKDLAILNDNPKGYILVRETTWKKPRYAVTEDNIQNSKIKYETDVNLNLNEVNKLFNVKSYKEVKPLKIKLKSIDKKDISIIEIPFRYLSFNTSPYSNDVDKKWKIGHAEYNKESKSFDKLSFNNYNSENDDIYYYFVDKVSSINIDSHLLLKIKILYCYKPFKFIVFNKKYKELINGINSLVPQYEFESIENFITKKSSIKKIKDFVSYSYIKGLFDNEFSTFKVMKINFGDSDISKILLDSKNDLFLFQQKYPDTYKKLNKYIATTMIENYSFKIDSKYYNIQDVYKKIKNKYKLFGLFQTYRIDDYIVEINEYIKMINEKEKLNYNKNFKIT